MNVTEYYIIEYNKDFEKIGLNPYIIHTNMDMKFTLFKTLDKAQKAIIEYINERRKECRQ